MNFGNVERFVRHGLWEEAETYFDEKITRLEGAGSDVILCVSNTMHQVVAPLIEARSTPFIHIADPTGDAIKAAGLKKVALLGTLPLMNSLEVVRRFQEKYGVSVIVPSDSDKPAANAEEAHITLVDAGLQCILHTSACAWPSSGAMASGVHA